MAVGLLFLPGAAAHAQQSVRAPDPATFSPDVRAAVAELTDIVARRDLAAFKQHLLPTATISFGGDYGPEGLDTVWEPQRSDTRLWIELEEILRLGGVQEVDNDGTREWCAPLASCMEFGLPEDVTGYDYLVVTATDVAVRAQPDASAPVLERTGRGPTALVLADGDTDAWRAVRVQGRVGYVRADLARSPVDYRIRLRIDPQDWHVALFVGGD